MVPMAGELLQLDSNILARLGYGSDMFDLFSTRTPAEAPSL